MTALLYLLVLVLKVTPSLPLEWEDALKMDPKLGIRGLTWNPSTWGMEAGIQGHLLYCKFEARLRYLRPSLRQKETTNQMSLSSECPECTGCSLYWESELTAMLAIRDLLSDLKSRSLPRMKLKG